MAGQLAGALYGYQGIKAGTPVRGSVGGKSCVRGLGCVRGSPRWVSMNVKGGPTFRATYFACSDEYGGICFGAKGSVICVRQLVQ